jgi:hypothetical protein
MDGLTTDHHRIGEINANAFGATQKLNRWHVYAHIVVSKRAAGGVSVFSPIVSGDAAAEIRDFDTFPLTVLELG